MNGLKRSRVAGILNSLLAITLSVGCSPSWAGQAASPAQAANSAQERGIRIGAKDLYYKQLNQANKAVINNLGLSFSIDVTRNGQTSRVNSQYDFHNGDAIQFHVKSNIDGYMYVFLTNGSTGKRAQLYPPNEELDQNRIEKGIEYSVPENGVLVFDENPGVEVLQLALSPTPIKADDVLGTTRSITIKPKGAAKVDTPLVSFENADEAALKHFAEIGAIGKPDTSTSASDVTGMSTAVSKDTSRPLTVDLVLQHSDPNNLKPSTVSHTTASAPTTPTTQVASNSGGRSGVPRIGPGHVDQKVKAATESVVASAVQDKWALVVGISKHKSTGLNLRFPDKDAQDFASYLIKEAHFAPDHVHTLINEQATKENILTEMGQTFLRPNVKPGDLVVVYIAGHGTSQDQDAYAEEVGIAGQNFLVAHDTDVDRLYATSIRMNDFVRELKQRLNTDRVLLVLDTCHSGAARDGQKSFGIGQMLRPMKVDTIPQGTGQMVIASSSANQTSHDSRRYSNGIFTKHLIDGLRKYTDIDQVFAYTKAQVEQEATKDFGAPQTPVIKEAEWKGGKLVLTAPPAKPRPTLEATN